MSVPLLFLLLLMLMSPLLAMQATLLGASKGIGLQTVPQLVLIAFSVELLWLPLDVQRRAI